MIANFVKEGNQSMDKWYSDMLVQLQKLVDNHNAINARVELQPGNEPLDYEDASAEAIASASAWDIATQVDRFRDLCYKLLWDPRTAAGDAELLRNVAYARIVLVAAGAEASIN